LPCSRQKPSLGEIVLQAIAHQPSDAADNAPTAVPGEYHCAKTTKTIGQPAAPASSPTTSGYATPATTRIQNSNAKPADDAHASSARRNRPRTAPRKARMTIGQIPLLIADILIALIVLTPYVRRP
jgi:hypothetical protein